MILWNLSRTALLIVICSVPLLAQDQQTIYKNEIGILKAISAREMNSEERARMAPDFIGATHIVRLRFEVTSKYSVSVWAPYCAEPEGYLLLRRYGKVRYTAGIGSDDPSQSPGFKALDSKLGSCWLLMRPGSAYEWETISDPDVDGEEARSIFIKTQKDGEPLEIISPWYNVLKLEEPTKIHQNSKE